MQYLWFVIVDAVMFHIMAGHRPPIGNANRARCAQSESSTEAPGGRRGKIWYNE